MHAELNAYLADIVAECAPPAGPLVSLVLFGSGATGGYSSAVSDVDLLLIVHDETGANDRLTLRARVDAIEMQHGLGKPKRPVRPLLESLQDFAEKVTANKRAFFICTRSDLLSGEPYRILGIPRSQAVLVDRVPIATIVASGVTIWGEDLLDRVPLPEIRRVDVGIALFGLFNQVLLSAGLYPLLYHSTQYAMDALKRSVHNCYFCFERRTTILADEIAFFEGRLGARRTLRQLLQLRGSYRPSLGFILRALAELVRLHAHTARTLSFPRAARRR